MLRVARLAFDIGDQPLGGQRREYALVIDFDDVGALLIEYPRDIVERARLILEPDAQPCEPARPREIAQQHVGEQSSVDIAAAQDDAEGLALEALGVREQRRQPRRARAPRAETQPSVPPPKGEH